MDTAMSNHSRKCTGSIQVHVIRAGAPLASAALTVVECPPDAPVIDVAPLTNVHGFAQMDDLLEGTWCVQALGLSGETGQGCCQVRRGCSTALIIQVR